MNQDWNNLGLPPDLVEQALATPPKQKAAAPTKRSAKAFTKFPAVWLDRLAEIKARGCTYQVARRLLDRARLTGRQKFELANVALRGLNITRESKRRALQELETAGLAQVERRSRKSPVVKLLLVE